jgi:hypothetical protein
MTMAIYISKIDENCLLMASQNLQNFPQIDDEDHKRISFVSNYINYLPKKFRCLKHVSFMLKSNLIKEASSGLLL